VADPRRHIALHALSFQGWRTILRGRAVAVRFQPWVGRLRRAQMRATRRSFERARIARVSGRCTLASTRNRSAAERRPTVRVKRVSAGTRHARSLQLMAAERVPATGESEQGRGHGRCVSGRSSTFDFGTIEARADERSDRRRGAAVSTYMYAAYSCGLASPSWRSG
jgi:hypothetical protein